MMLCHRRFCSSVFAIEVAFLSACALMNGATARPNFIIMQPDDFQFLSEWKPPAHFPGNSGVSMPTTLLPHINRLRREGVTMDRAYTASPQCGTSRYSTLTGRYPSRSAHSRSRQGTLSLSSVTIPLTKLVDVATVADGNDCSESNLAAVLQTNGYRTGFMGKWHLGLGGRAGGPAYGEARESIQACGFDTAEAIYWENLNRDDPTEYLHNLEHLAEEAIRFIDSAVNEGKEFFLYFNPTAPHASGSVLDSLTTLTCRQTPQGTLDVEPVIPGMTAGVGCEAYRKTILDRANGDTSNQMLGNIWVDDTVGALLQHLETVGQLDNTFFLFQLDHGQEGKSSLYEPGIRTAQFVRYPNEISSGSSYRSLVSTIDIAPTVMDYAGIRVSSSGWYPTDGESWRSLLTRPDVWDRCIVSELDKDRTVVCQCEKVLEIGDTTDSRTVRRTNRSNLAGAGNLQLCDGSEQYITGPNSSPEVSIASDSAEFDFLQDVMDCHKEMTRPGVNPLYDACDELQPLPIPIADPADLPIPNIPLPTSEAPTRSPPTSPAPITTPTSPAPITTPTSPAPMTVAPVSSNPTSSPISMAPANLSTGSPTAAPFSTSSMVSEPSPSSSVDTTPTPTTKSLPPVDESMSGATTLGSFVRYVVSILLFAML